jgi:hypothetical protein
MMNDEFKRMLKLAGINEATIMYGNNSHYYDKFKELISKFPELYTGLRQILTSPQFRKEFDRFRSEKIKQYSGFYTFRNNNDPKEVEKYVDIELENGRYLEPILSLWGKTFLKNLADNGFKFKYNRHSDSYEWKIPIKYQDRIPFKSLEGYEIVEYILPEYDNSDVSDDFDIMAGEYFGL